MRLIDAKFLECLFYGSRQMRGWLDLQGYAVGRKRVRRLMRLMGIEAISRKPRASVRHREHKVYPYLLRDRAIDRANQFWCADIAYIPIRKGFLYLVAIMDWYSRKVLSWGLSNSMEARFCIEALQEALTRYPKPEIMNTDQGSQFTGLDWVETLKRNRIKVSMDGKGRWIYNVFIDRLWRSLKYECVYLQELSGGKDARKSIGQWINLYHRERPHSTLDGEPPDMVYFAQLGLAPTERKAA